MSREALAAPPSSVARVRCTVTAPPLLGCSVGVDVPASSRVAAPAVTVQLYVVTGAEPSPTVAASGTAAPAVAAPGAGITTVGLRGATATVADFSIVCPSSVATVTVIVCDPPRENVTFGLAVAPSTKVAPAPDHANVSAAAAGSPVTVTETGTAVPAVAVAGAVIVSTGGGARTRTVLRRTDVWPPLSSTLPSSWVKRPSPSSTWSSIVWSPAPANAWSTLVPATAGPSSKRHEVALISPRARVDVEVSVAVAPARSTGTTNAATGAGFGSIATWRSVFGGGITASSLFVVS